MDVHIRIHRSPAAVTVWCARDAHTSRVSEIRCRGNGDRGTHTRRLGTGGQYVIDVLPVEIVAASLPGNTAEPIPARCNIPGWRKHFIESLRSGLKVDEAAGGFRKSRRRQDDVCPVGRRRVQAIEHHEIFDSRQRTLDQSLGRPPEQIVFRHDQRVDFAAGCSLEQALHVPACGEHRCAISICFGRCKQQRRIGAIVAQCPRHIGGGFDDADILRAETGDDQGLLRVAERPRCRGDKFRIRVNCRSRIGCIESVGDIEACSGDGLG